MEMDLEMGFHFLSMVHMLVYLSAVCVLIYTMLIMCKQDVLMHLEAKTKYLISTYDQCQYLQHLQTDTERINKENSMVKQNIKIYFQKIIKTENVICVSSLLMNKKRKRKGLWIAYWLPGFEGHVQRH